MKEFMKDTVKKTVHATRVPTLLIGLGGIGGRIVREVEMELRDFDKQYVKMLVLDTNVNDLTKSSGQRIQTIQTSENQTVSDYLRQHPSYLEWFPTNPLINGKNLTQGAGQIRSVSRLGALSSEGAHRFDTISEAIDELNRNRGASLQKMIRIMIVGSVSGGTCSGMAIQLPFYIRKLVEQKAQLPRVIIRGLFVMSDITEGVQDTNAKRSAVHVNSYAFLRELNGFYHAQTYEKGTQKLNIEHYNPPKRTIKEDSTAMAKQVPYDFLFLIEKSNINGQNIGSFDDYIVKAGKIVRSQLFASNISDDMYSTEDNLIVSLVDTNGMRRYCGAGASSVIYPEEENIRYCILRYTESILQGYWLQTDKATKRVISEHKRLMAADRTLKPLDPQLTYIAQFNKLTDPKQTSMTAQFGMLARELFSEFQVKDKEDGSILRTVTLNEVDAVYSAIQNYLKKSFFNQSMQLLSSQCEISSDECDNRDDAIKNLTARMNMLRKYEKEAEDRVGVLTSSCVESIMPADAVSAQNYSERVKHRQCIYTALNSKHPIVARYILYSLREKLSRLVASSTKEIESKNTEEEINNTVFEKDYYTPKRLKGEDKVVDHPAQALNQVDEPGIFKGKEFYAIVKNVINDIAAYSERIKELSELKLFSDVCSGVIERLDILIEKYENFFKELEAIQIHRHEERVAMESHSNNLRKSDLYVCADKNCKDWLYTHFEEQLTDESDITLPEDIKKTFFESIFNEYSKQLNEKFSATEFGDEELSMEKLFEQGIIEPMINKYQKVQLKHVHMGVIEAIGLEYKIHKKLGVLSVNDVPIQNPEFSEKDYFIAVTKQVRELARPYLAYTSVPEHVSRMISYDEDTPTDIGKLLCFWGINNGIVAKYQNVEWDQVDDGALKKMFGNPDGATVSVVYDDSFNPHELLCYCSIYDFSIENLPKYNTSSTAYKEYCRRMIVVNKGNYNVGIGRDDYLKSVHPHLDKNWHKHSYLPELYINDEMKMRESIRKAFLLGVSCNYCSFTVGDVTRRWAYGLDTITLGNMPARRSSYYTLYQCMDENSVVVDGILEREDNLCQSAYDGVRMFGIDLPSLLQQSIIKAFIGRKLTDEEIKDFQKAFDNTTPNSAAINILDVLFSVYKDSFDQELVKSLVDTLTKYIRDYCIKMCNGRKEYAEILANEVYKEIGKNSKADINENFRLMCAKYF